MPASVELRERPLGDNEIDGHGQCTGRRFFGYAGEMLVGSVEEFTKVTENGRRQGYLPGIKARCLDHHGRGGRNEYLGRFKTVDGAVRAITRKAFTVSGSTEGRSGLSHRILCGKFGTKEMRAEHAQRTGFQPVLKKPIGFSRWWFSYGWLR